MNIGRPWCLNLTEAPEFPICSKWSKKPMYLRFAVRSLIWSRLKISLWSNNASIFYSGFKEDSKFDSFKNWAKNLRTDLKRVLRTTSVHFEIVKNFLFLLALIRSFQFLLRIFSYLSRITVSPNPLLFVFFFTGFEFSY